MNSSLGFSSAGGPTQCQQSIRRRLNQVSFRRAVRRAADVFFRFQYRASKGPALWCGTHRVWMGSETFLHWAILDGQIDIPWVVASTLEAPCGAEDLRKAVHAELLAYWQDRSASLPCKAKPQWLPLP